MRPIFVGGTGRSGTTITKRVLLEAPETGGVGGELRWHVDPTGLLDVISVLRDRWTPFRGDEALYRFRRLLERHEDKCRAIFGREEWKRAVGELYLDLTNGVSGTRWHSVEPREEMYETRPLVGDRRVQRIVRAFLLDGLYGERWPEAEAMVEDTPENVQVAHELERAFGNDVIVIHAVRHPLDVVASMWARVEPQKGTPMWWADSPEGMAWRVREAMLAAEAVEPRVQVEALARDPEGETRALASRCGVTWTPEMAEIVEPAQANIGRWKDDLEPEELRTVIPLLRSAAEAYGYQMPDPGDAARRVENYRAA